MDKPDLARALRALIRENGRAIYIQALDDCGVPEEEMDDADDEQIDTWTGVQLEHVSDFASAVIAARGDKDAQNAINGRVDDWIAAARSLATIACMMAKKNEMITLDGDDGEESCLECQRYKGQWHRASWWLERDLVRRNGNENYGCGRWDNCHHNFITRDGKQFGEG